MNDDDDLCLCFHVTRRKVVQYIRVEKPKRLSELSNCYGAGTGCGWCRPFLQRLMAAECLDSETLPSPEEYARQRERHRRQ